MACLAPALQHLEAVRRLLTWLESGMRRWWAILPVLWAMPAHAAEPDKPPPALMGSDEWEFRGPPRLDLGLRVGYGRRLDQPPFYRADNRNGVVIGPEVALFLVRRVAIGLAYEHYELGSEETGITPTGIAHVSRRLDTLWLGTRLYPVMLERGGVYLGIAAGPAWQGADFAGSAWLAHDPGQSVSFACNGSDTPGVALRAEVGGDVAIAGGLHALFAAGFDGYRLGDDVLDDCVPGAGTATVFGLRAALVYAMDLL